MPWSELILEVPREVADEAAALLAARGVMLELRDAETIDGAPAGRVELRLYVAPERAEEEQARVTRLMADVASRQAATADYRLTVARLEDESWRDAWKRFFHAQRVGERFLIRPSWDLVAPGPDDRVIDLDPGRAFGTGGHATTRLCLLALEWLEAEGLAPRRILDAGCGSGILSIGALRIWPGISIEARDVDPEAVATARENAELNGVSPWCSFVVADTDAVSGLFDLVVANIQLSVLRRVAASLGAAVGPGGRLVLSGLLEGEDEEVAPAYRDQGLVVTRMAAEGEWRALLLRRG